ncbi:MAG: glycosyltransferase family 2 protein, partial [Planctomycetota bacterium]
MKVSIVTVCLNSGQTLEDTVRSVLGQDYEDIEYIIVDGGSTDGTTKVLDKYHDRISKFVSEPDKGTYDAMNKGIKMATGEVVGFLNAGDFYATDNAISSVVACLQKTDVDVVYADLDDVAQYNPAKTVRRWRSESYREGLFEKGWQPPHPTFFVKKRLFDDYSGFDLDYRISADYEIMLRFLKKYKVRSCHIPKVLVKMRTGGKSNRSLWQIIRANIECYQAWQKNGLQISPLIMLSKPASKLVQY